MGMTRRSMLLGSMSGIGAGGVGAGLLAPHVARGAPRRLRAGHNNSPTSSLQAACLAFKAYVVERTEGRYEVDIYPSAQLGNDTQLIKAVAAGTMDLTISATSIMGIYHQDMELVELPYLFKDVAAARTAMGGELGRYCAELVVKEGLVVIGWGENGMRHMTANKPIRAVADLQGLKLRVQPGKIQVESFNGLGAVAAPLNFNELPEALRTGRFDAQENPLGIVLANDFLPKFQSHLSLTNHVYSPFPISFSADVLDEMSPADRVVILSAGKLAAQATIAFNETAVATGIERLRAGGMVVVQDVDRAGFQAAMEALGPRLAALAGAEAINRVRGLIA